jgi:HEAT repeat protein
MTRPFLLKVSADFSTYHFTSERRMKGATMQKIFGVVVAAVLLSTNNSGTSVAMSDAAGGVDEMFDASLQVSSDREPIDVASLLSAARGATPVICSLAAQSVRGWGWGNWSDAPVTPLGKTVVVRESDSRDRALSSADIQLLLQSLESDDACVREIGVRMIGRSGSPAINSGLIERLGSPSASLRSVAALGLGLAEPPEAVDPLIRALRDSDTGVRANSAWALGNLDSGRALQPLLGIVGDNAEPVREAAVVAVGRLDSTRAASTLIRVLRQDDSPAVRRVAAWALGELEARVGVEALSAALGGDSDARVREMSAWALGNIESHDASAALLGAARRDADDKVRETAVWALGQIEDGSVADALAQIAASDKNSRVRGTAAWAIGQMRDDGGRVPSALLQLLTDENADTRLKAAWAVGQIGDSSALSAIHAAIKVERIDEVNRALIRALLKSGERSEAALTQLIDSKDPRVREAAVRGLAGRSSFNPWPWPQPRPRPFP